MQVMLKVAEKIWVYPCNWIQALWYKLSRGIWEIETRKEIKVSKQFRRVGELVKKRVTLTL